MIARQNRISNDDIDRRPSVNYYDIRDEKDPFPGASLVDPIDSDQHKDISSAIDKMVQAAVDKGFPNEYLEELKEIVSQHKNIVRTTFSSGPPAAI